MDRSQPSAHTFALRARPPTSCGTPAAQRAATNGRTTRRNDPAPHPPLRAFRHTSTLTLPNHNGRACRRGATHRP